MLGATQGKLAIWAVTRRSLGFKSLFVLAAFVISFLLRYELHDSLPAGFPYLTFFPAVVVTTFFAGVASGLVLATLCGMAAWYVFIDPELSFALTSASAIALGLYIFVVVVDIVLIHATSQVLTRLAEERTRSAHLAKSSDLMFSELQHRVSNNLQVISSMLKFQRRSVGDPAARQALDVASARLAVVARVQRALHDPTRQSVGAGDLLRRILPDVVDASGAAERVSLSVSAEDAAMSADQSMPFALIATELVSNAIEHALLPQGHLTLQVKLTRQGSTARLEVSDDGPGFPPDFDLATTQSFGLMIARQFAEQLNGRLAVTHEGGAMVRLDFPTHDTGLTAACDAFDPESKHVSE